MKQHLLFFLKNMMRRKGVSGMAIGSLSLGIAVVLLIGLWVQEEFSFDRFHKDSEHIYRLYTQAQGEGEGDGTFRQLGDNMQKSFPEVKSYCRTARTNGEYRVNKVLFQGFSSLQVDGNFFSFFTFPLKSGNIQSCLDEPNKMVISESTAKKWFPGQDPIGQSVEAREQIWQVAAVMKDMPYNSHIQCDVVIPFLGRAARLDCPSDMFRTYLYVPKISDKEELEKRLTKLNWDCNSLMQEMKQEIKLRCLRDVYFNETGNKPLVIALAVTALAILLIACINFINLFIAVSFLRVKEVGVKKTFGAGKNTLMKSFYLETLSYVVVATGIGFVLAVLLLPMFNRLANYYLTIDFGSPWLYVYLIGVVMFTTLIAGSYPAVYMTRFGVIDTVNRQFRGKKLSFFQNSLLVLQFTVSVVFLILIFFVHKQVNYMVGYDLGFNKENIVYMPASGGMFNHYASIREELLRTPQIKEVSLRQSLPMRWADGYPLRRPSDQERFQFELCQIEPNFLEMMGIDVIEGENPFYNRQVDNNLLIDEKGVEVLDLKEPIGTELRIWGRDFVIRGIVRTTQNKILKDKSPNPLVYMSLQENMANLDSYYFMCKVEDNPQEAIDALEKQWAKYVPDRPFQYNFLDETYEKLYESEVRLSKIFLCALVITVVLSLTGLFAVAYYKSERQLKDISIRRVNGAMGKDLLVLLNYGFMWLVAISVCIAASISYYVISLWMNGFVVRTSLSWWIFAGAGAIAFIVTVSTVSIQVWRVLRIRPVEILKRE